MKKPVVKGNIIEADFRPKSSLSFAITFNTKILFIDEKVVLVRISYLIDGKPCGKLPDQHVTVDL
jgi:hypothetical protein